MPYLEIMLHDRINLWKLVSSFEIGYQLDIIISALLSLTLFPQRESCGERKRKMYFETQDKPILFSVLYPSLHLVSKFWWMRGHVSRCSDEMPLCVVPHHHLSELKSLRSYQERLGIHWDMMVRSTFHTYITLWLSDKVPVDKPLTSWRGLQLSNSELYPGS